VVKSIACKRKIHAGNVSRRALWRTDSARIFEIFDRNETAVDMVATSEVQRPLTIRQHERLETICEELRQFAAVDRGGPGDRVAGGETSATRRESRARLRALNGSIYG